MLRKLMMTGLSLAVLLTAVGTGFAGEVFITKQGKKYHHAQCALIKNRDTTALSEEKALAQGYKPCRKCMSDDEVKNSGALKKGKAASGKKS